MNTRSMLKAGLAALLIIAAVAAWLTRDQRQINRNLDRLRKLVSKSAEEKTIGGLIRAKEITGYFAVPVDVELGPPFPGFNDRNELAAAIHHARSMTKEIEVTIRNKTLDIGANHTSARMALAAEALVTIGSQTDRDIREFRLTWVKQQGKWLISKVELTETIRRPQGLGNSYF
jgi:hypothetical protein